MLHKRDIAGHNSAALGVSVKKQSYILLLYYQATNIQCKNTTQHPNPLVLLPKSGYIYLKSDGPLFGYYIFRSSPIICEILEKTTLPESRVFCARTFDIVTLTIDIITGSFLMVQQYDAFGKNMWAALVKLQRWFRWVPHHYTMPRRAAIAMCLHERLGKGSKLSSIGADIIELIVRRPRGLAQT